MPNARSAYRERNLRQDRLRRLLVEQLEDRGLLAGVQWTNTEFTRAEPDGTISMIQQGICTGPSCTWHGKGISTRRMEPGDTVSTLLTNPGSGTMLTVSPHPSFWTAVDGQNNSGEVGVFIASDNRLCAWRENVSLGQIGTTKVGDTVTLHAEGNTLFVGLNGVVLFQHENVDFNGTDYRFDVAFRDRGNSGKSEWEANGGADSEEPSRTVLFQDGFEASSGDVVGSRPTISGDNVGVNWTMDLIDNGIIDIADANVDGGSLSGVAPHPGSGAQYMRLHRSITAQSSSNVIGRLSETVASGRIQLTYELYNKTVTGRSGGSHVVLGVKGSDYIPHEQRILNIVFLPDGSIGRSTGSAFESIAEPGSYQLDQWQAVTIDVDLDAKTYSITVEGDIKAEGISFQNAKFTTVSDVVFSPAGNTVSFVDDVLFVANPPEELPDIAITSAYLSGATTVEFKYDVTGVSKFDVRLFRSTDAQFDPSDTELGVSQPIETTGQTGAATLSLSTPITWLPGTPYLILVANPNEALQEIQQNGETDKARPILDTDKDGLPDLWEVAGFDEDGNGTIDVDLPRMGASPLMRDVFVEVDYMDGCPVICRSGLRGTNNTPIPRAIALVVKAFLEHNIALHVDYGTDAVMNPFTGEKWGTLSKADRVDFQAELHGLGKTNSRIHYDWKEFGDIKAKYFTQARARIFHYSVFAHKLGGGGWTGVSRNTLDDIKGGASDFIVSPGGDRNEGEQAGTFMHELGRDLGLRHGGGDSVNYKPNYLSIMNYFFSRSGPTIDRSGLTIDGSPRHYNYSEFELDPLDEEDLDETKGLEGHEDVSRYSTKHWCEVKKPMEGDSDNSMQNELVNPMSDDAKGWIDWNCDGVEDDTRVSNKYINEKPARQNSPDLKPQELHGHDDWSNLVFDGGAVGAFGAIPELPQEAGIVEATLEELRAIVEGYDLAVAAPPTAAVLPGQQAVLQFEVQNLGTEPDTYRLELVSDNGWATLSLTSPQVTLSSGTSETILVTVEVPAGASPGSLEPISLIATSQTAGTLSEAGASGVLVGPTMVDGTLVIGAGTGNDRIVVSAAFGGGIRVRVNRLVFGPFTPTEIIVDAGPGNDSITVAGSLDLPVQLLGGPGNDYLAGGAGDDQLFGGEGDDRILAGNGNNLLDGGSGNDRLSSRGGDDVLIGGDGQDRLRGDRGVDLLIADRTNHDSVVTTNATAAVAVDTALRDILNDWQAGIFDVALLFGDDGDKDDLTGGSDNDWFWFTRPDRVRDQRTGDRAN